MIKKINGIYFFTTIHIFSGALRWKDLMELASPSLIAKVHNLQRDIQIDEAANIQFTSVHTMTLRMSELVIFT